MPTADVLPSRRRYFFQMGKCERKRKRKNQGKIKGKRKTGKYKGEI
jgi:hypothetical protein